MVKPYVPWVCGKTGSWVSSQGNRGPDTGAHLLGREKGLLAWWALVAGLVSQFWSAQCLPFPCPLATHVPLSYASDLV